MIIQQIFLLLAFTWLGPGPSNAQSDNETTCAPVSCAGLTLQDPKGIRKQFLDLKTLREAYVIKLHVQYNDGVSEDQVKATGLPYQNDTFDPHTWMWVSRYGTYAIDRSLDYKFVSLGLLQLKEYDLRIVFVGGRDCTEAISGECWDRALFQMLGELTWPMERRMLPYGEQTPRDYLCRSSYVSPSFLSGALGKGVGWKCCSYEDNILKRCDTGAIIKEPNLIQQRVVFAFVIILSVGLYAVLHGFARARLTWYTWKGESWEGIGKYFGYGPSTYRTYILDIGPGNSKRWVHVSDEQLLRGENTVSVPEFWQLFGGPYQSGKCLVIFKFVLVLIIYAAVAVIIIPKVYDEEHDTLELFQDGEEVALNLRSVPLAWWRTNTRFWPRKFGIFLMVGFFIALTLELILILVFIIGFRSRPPKDFQHYLSDSRNKTKKPKRKRNSTSSMLLSVLLLSFDLILGFIAIAAIVYPLVQVIVHVCLAVIIHIDILTPWVIAFVMTLFHVYLNYQQFRQPYVDIKEILHAEFLNSQEAIQAYTIWNIQNNKSVRAFKSETEETDSTEGKPVAPIQKLPPRMLRTLLVTFQQDRRPNILMEHFLKVSHHLVSNRRAVWGFVMRLVLFLSYLAVIMSSVTAFRASPGGGERSTEGLVTGAVVFVFLLVPHAYVGARRRYGSNTCRLLWRLEIQRFMRSLETEWDGQFDSPEAKLRATFNRKRRREQWSVILEDDEVNPDPPLQFPDRISENGSREAAEMPKWPPRPITTTIPSDVTADITPDIPPLVGSSPEPTNGVGTVLGPGGPGVGPVITPSDVPEVGSASTLAEETPMAIRMAGSMSNMSNTSNFSSTTT